MGRQVVSYRVSDLNQDIIRTNFSGGGSLNDLSLLRSLEDSEFNHFDRCGIRCGNVEKGVDID